MLYFIGVVTIPFDAVPGLAVLGEVAHEASFYLFFPALLYAALLVVGGMLEGSIAPVAGSRWITWCAIALVCCVAVSGIVNLPGIAVADFHGRNGMPKYITSVAVILYGLALAWLTAAVVGRHWYERFIVPICVSASICVIVSIFERASLSGLNIPPVSSFYSLIHSGSEGPAVLWDGSLNLKMLEGWDRRLRSVSFEPPAFGNFAGLIWPWLACGAVMARGSRRLFHVALLATFTGLIVVAQARTGWLLLACDIGTFAALWFIVLPGNGRPKPLWIAMASAGGIAVMLGGGIYYALSYDALVRKVVEGQSISDLTRFAYQVTALKIFLGNPLFGVGLGQFAFTATDFMPSWGFLSSEIHASLIYPEAPWPNTYSIYARLGAEMGIGGLVVWIGIWVATVLGLHMAAVAQARLSGRVPWEYFAIFMSIAAILVSGFTTDTFRTPLIWTTLGAAASAIGRVRKPI